MTRTAADLEAQLSELEASYKVAATAARQARARGEDPTPYWRTCQGFFRMAKRARAQLLLADWSASS